MSESVSASMTIQADTLRYVELEREDQGYRLRRLEERDFPFSLVRVLFYDGGTDEQMQRVRAAVQEVTAETEARALRIGIHPLDGYSFFTPIPSEAPVRERQRQLLQQASLVTGTRSSEELCISSQTVRTAQDSDGEAFMWVHVLAVPQSVDDRMHDLVAGLSVDAYDWMVSSEGAARVMGRAERTGGSAQEALRPYTLAVGQYSTHTEYVLTRNRGWYHSHYAEEAHSPENRAYFAVGFFNRTGVPLDAVGRLFLYGCDVEEADYAPFESIFGQEPEILDPFALLRGNPERPERNACAYAPCIGAGMDEYVG